MTKPESLLEKTIAAAIADERTVSDDGVPIRQLPDGMRERASIKHIDDRGSVTEMFDTRWNWHPDPIEFVYQFSIRPGAIKGWGLHQRHEDRYFLLKGEMELVLYDVRPDSSTYGKVSKIVLSEDQPKIVSVPSNVWHADHNIGDTEVLVVNFPTIQYDHSAPDKIRLPLDTPLIPYDFGPDAKGW
ncbi:dTDP-4-dehydrorhamnose 3,5-epimerase family protein [uncultured Tateyamaria sp.]|uniref:polysaccharide biosynthesis C-terminal domain-containing protein n=2 Tax=Tateyamaria TaxID=299261 RepID=UPI002615D62C|nr:dTDP-4-dehydrorhamnose 3,5-epimerase family protein [uncultured Tateyamaria sp.]